ncbi:protein kinase A catalytic subunit isoform 1 [Reticulomyxa filosa]|uniref:Protein kinase A catalytic subunit isoform 1 n=1 Tax=Reticulomyxa filosa TaxID=46433 RepID=X6M8J1_RETFI|nr:protein kinase A catalytic subunit isoform 1 [Reticulomyxa filosa]|eukprot:ETO10308.1 protein kinase A catalytic subunit isoform 1 [Reticulomyxa filosa]
MHSKDIVYRDLKPENLVLDDRGYLKVTDFGFAKIVTDKTFTLCGTPDYLAPEIVIGQGHGRAVDWWTLGVLIYEMLASFPPFFDEDPMQTYRKIIRGHLKFPRYFTQESRELIRQLLRSRPVKRLGILKGGADNIRMHPWFQTFAWKDFLQGTLQAPIVNPVKDHKDLSNFSKEKGETGKQQKLCQSNLTKGVLFFFQISPFCDMKGWAKGTFLLLLLNFFCIFHWFNFIDIQKPITFRSNRFFHERPFSIGVVEVISPIEEKMRTLPLFFYVRLEMGYLKKYIEQIIIFEIMEMPLRPVSFIALLRNNIYVFIIKAYKVQLHTLTVTLNCNAKV